MSSLGVEEAVRLDAATSSNESGNASAGESGLSRRSFGMIWFHCLKHFFSFTSHIQMSGCGGWFVFQECVCIRGNAHYLQQMTTSNKVFSKSGSLLTNAEQMPKKKNIYLTKKKPYLTKYERIILFHRTPSTKHSG